MESIIYLLHYYQIKLLSPESGYHNQKDHKPLAKFLNGKNANSKVNGWGLELATFKVTFGWISGAHNKAADCLSCLVELP